MQLSLSLLKQMLCVSALALPLGVRRLDAAFLRRGSTRRKTTISKFTSRQAVTEKSGVKPPHSQKTRLTSRLNSIVFLIFLLITRFSFADDEKFSIEPYREFFKDILLVIYYDKPDYETIDFHTSLYCPVFKYIVYYGDTKSEDPEIDVDIVDTENGQFFTRIVQDVLRGYPGYKGYLFLHSESIFQFWNCIKFDKDKIWSGQVKEGEFFVHSVDPNYPSGFNASLGMPELKRIFSFLPDAARAQLAANIGPERVVSNSYDCFYLPGRFSNAALPLSELFQNVDSLVSLPTLLLCLDSSFLNREDLTYTKSTSDQGNAFIAGYKANFHFLSASRLSRLDFDFAKRMFKEEFYSQLIEEVDCD